MIEEADAPSRPPEGFPEAITQLRHLRGTYLDQVVTLETVLDAFLFDYLAAPEHHRQLFHGTVARRLSLRDKVETMCDFIDDFALLAPDGDLPHSELQRSLRDAVTWLFASRRPRMRALNSGGRIVLARRAAFGRA